MPGQYSSSVRQQIVARLRLGEPVAAVAAEGKDSVAVCRFATGVTNVTTSYS